MLILGKTCLRCILKVPLRGWYSPQNRSAPAPVVTTGAGTHGYNYCVELQ